MPTRREQLFQAVQEPMRFNDCKMLIGHFGFRLASMNRLHHVYVHERVATPISLQNVNGFVKPFQIRQLLNLILSYQLRADDDPPLQPFDPKATP